MAKAVSMAELRLALVCYGGVSLAVYMHGVTKELHKFVTAAAEYEKCRDTGASNNPFRDDKTAGSEAAYFDALADAARAGTPLRVNIDIIGGTSAGGINGIALGKALAQRSGLDALTDVWLERGDIRQLLRAPWLFGRLLPKAVWAGVNQVIRAGTATSPLRGEYLANQLFDALTEMDKGAGDAASPPNRIELYVPTTDLDGFEVLVPSGAGGASQRDYNNAQVLQFDSDQEQFGPGYTASLAFAGRATSSFPGAFAPVSPDSFRDEIGARNRPEVQIHPEIFRYSGEAADDRDHSQAYFVDGGVLDNAPFDVVISAIARRQAQTQVFRRLIYVQPDPGQALYHKSAAAEKNGTRRYLADLLAVSKVKGAHPVVRELFALRDMNDRIGEVSAIAERQMSTVLGQINEVLDQISDGSRSSDTAPIDAAAAPRVAPGTAQTAGKMAEFTDHDKVQHLSDEMHRQAAVMFGPAWSTYRRLKFKAVLHRLVNELCRRNGFRWPTQSGRACFLQAAFVEWARTDPAWIDDGTGATGDTSALEEMLRASDTPYRERRLQFIIAGINELYVAHERPPVEDLDRLKASSWQLLSAVQAQTKKAVADIADTQLEFVRSVGSDTILRAPSEFAAEHTDAFADLFKSYADNLCRQLGNDSVELWQKYIEITAPDADPGRRWSPENREALLTRYLGFPMWDAMIFPTIALTDVPQLSPIGVAQFSPLMATALEPRDAQGQKTAKLKGIPLHHFAAFFDAASRENDYLWGRLDGAELILKLLRDVATPGAADPTAADGDPTTIPRLTEALTAILDSEQHLRRVTALRDDLRGQVEAMTGNTSAQRSRV